MSDSEDATSQDSNKENLRTDEEGDGSAEDGEKIPDNPLVQEFIPECLSLLCKIGSGLSHAYVRFDGRERDFTNIDHLKDFVHIRYLDLTGNLLKDISVVNNLKHLLVLKVAKNNLTTVELEPLNYLQEASFADNKIEKVEPITHPLLEKLNLNSNQIERVTGLDPDVLTNLTFLELRGNRLTSIEGIEIPTLKSLYLAANRLTDLCGIGKMVNLQTLHVRDNQIASLDGFSDSMTRLNYVNLRGNSVAEISELEKLQVLPELQSISLSENPCVEGENYRIEVLILLRKLERLDKDHYSTEERTEAEDIYDQRRLAEQNKEEPAQED